MRTVVFHKDLEIASLRRRKLRNEAFEPLKNSGFHHGRGLTCRIFIFFHNYGGFDMVIKCFFIPAVVMLFMVGCSPSENLTSNNSGEANPNNPTTSTAPSSNLGSFQAAEHPTQGNTRITKEGEKNYLEFDQSFRSDAGPDLFVILYRDATVPNSGIREQDYVTIAPLKSTSGSQRYLLPERVNLGDYKSVAIWCRQFNSTFGFAPLNASSS